MEILICTMMIKLGLLQFVFLILVCTTSYVLYIFNKKKITVKPYSSFKCSNSEKATLLLYWNLYLRINERPRGSCYCKFH